MRLTNKGQALVEFVIILPIVLLLVFSIIDIGRVISLKSDLESITSDAVMLYQEGKTPEEINELINVNRKEKISISTSLNDNYVTIKSESSIKPITPGLSLIAKKVFNVETSRVIRNE